MSILEITSIGLLIVNFIFIYFYFSMNRQNKKAIIKTSFIGYDKWVEEENDKQDVLEYEPLYLNVENVSNNQINSLKINISFIYNGEKIEQREERLDYLNPNEKVVFNIEIGFLKEKLTDKFEVHKIEDGGELTSPKEDLKFGIEFIFGWSYFFKQKDFYQLTWRKFGKDGEDYKSYNDYPILSYNMRNGKYIYK